MSSALAAPAAGAAGATGLAALLANPLFLPILLSFGPAGIAKLFGHKTPEEKAREQIEQLLANRSKMVNENFRQVVSSPAYSAAQGSIATGANQASNNVAANLAERGIGTTGTGAVLSGLTPSLVGSQNAKLLSSAHSTATDMFESELQKRIAAINGAAGPSRSAQLFGGGLDAFRPYLNAYLKQKFPGMYATPITGQTVTS
jgi:hypothetical protein